jgi:predicted transcriptional regulator
MSFRFVQLSELVLRKPREAHSRLRVLFSRHLGDVGGVSVELGVNKSTVFRWLKRLVDAGLDDPRAGRRGRRGPKRQQG